MLKPSENCVFQRRSCALIKILRIGTRAGRRTILPFTSDSRLLLWAIVAEIPQGLCCSRRKDTLTGQEQQECAFIYVKLIGDRNGMEWPQKNFQGTLRGFFPIQSSLWPIPLLEARNDLWRVPVELINNIRNVRGFVSIVSITNFIIITFCVGGFRFYPN